MTDSLVIKPLLRALARERNASPPIWLMRQAGRYLPEYRAIREKTGSFLDLCFNPKLAAEVTLQPIRRFGFDAAILFSDILVIPHALGQRVTFEEGEGPKLEALREPATLARLRAELDQSVLAPVYETIARVRQDLPKDVALLGFCGAPWTVATYMIAGCGTADQAPARLFAYNYPQDFARLIDKLIDASVGYPTVPRSVECGWRMTNDTTPPLPPASPALIDIGINLGHDSYDSDRDAVIARAEASGVVQMMVTGASLDGSQKALELARSRPGRLFATAGVHPHHATELTPDSLSVLEELARQPEVVAAGECGLDYFRDFSPRPVQQAAFHRQLELAARVRKPVFLHQRDAHEDFLAILKEHRSTLIGGVTHCFTGAAQELTAYLELGFAIGITGWICDERRGAHLLPLMREIPAERLLLETDGPYLLPRDLRPKPASRRNEPAYLPHIAAAVARARGESVATLARSSTAATRTLFGLPSI